MHQHVAPGVSPTTAAAAAAASAPSAAVGTTAVPSSLHVCTSERLDGRTFSICENVGNLHVSWWKSFAAELSTQRYRRRTW